MAVYLEFESQIAELEGKIAEIRALSGDDDSDSITTEVAPLEKRAQARLAEIYRKLTPWQKTLVARHPERPHCRHYIEQLISEFTPLAGDRKFGEDAAILGGLGRFNDEPVVVIGQEKGDDTQTRLHHNFGMARPEGYRKTVRLLDMADKFSLPVISFIDTAGAYPGIGAEERGQAEAIARATQKCLQIGVPMIAVIIGEGGSGGAIAIASANKVLMLEHAIYSVISPEGAASILWHDSARAEDAATAMRITAQDLEKLNIIEEIIAEPIGGAHRDAEAAISATGAAIAAALLPLKHLSSDELRQQRSDRFLAIGRQLG